MSSPAISLPRQQPTPLAPSAVRISELVSALTYALDLTEGQVPGHSVRSCLIGMRIGEQMGLNPEASGHLYYALLLKDLGCSSNAARVAAIFGSDDHAVKQSLKTVDWSRFLPAARYGLANAARGRGIVDRAYHAARIGLAGQRGARALMKVRCERGAATASQMGFSDHTADAIRALDEHWDGHGHPDGLRGTEIPLLARIAGLSQTAEVFLSRGGRGAALAVLQARNGTWFDPHLVDIVRGFADDIEWWRAIRTADAEPMVLAVPGSDIHLPVDDGMLDRIAEGFADVIDAKSPYTSQHSRGVAAYAAAIGRSLGLKDDAIRDLHRAGLVHDIGKLGVSNRILDKPGRLTDQERTAIERHPVMGWKILERVEAFARFAWSASLHHERLDGTGYPWRIGAGRLDLSARVLAVADVFEALTADRPYRAGMPAARALEILHEGAETHYDPRVIRALIESIS